MMDSNAKEIDTATLAKFSKIFLEHQILWQNKYKFWSWDRRNFEAVFMELCAIYRMVKYDINEVRDICDKFCDDHMSTFVQMIESFIKMRGDVYETLKQAPEWLWWLRKEMLEMPVEHNVFKITEFQMKLANSMWLVMVKMYGITEPPSSGEGGSSVASGDVNLNCENRAMRVDTEISVEHIDCTPLECLMKEYNITKEKLQEIWCRWRKVIVEKLSAMSRGDIGLSPLRSVDWSLVDQLLLFDSQVPTLIQEDLEPIMKSLKILFHLVTKHQVEECDPMERRSRWDMVHREYNSSSIVRHKASCVLLQRWWYELKLSTQRVFRKLWHSLKSNGTHKDTPLPESLQCEIALRYRHVVTEELPSWTELVRSGGVVVLMGINGDSTKGWADQPNVQPTEVNDKDTISGHNIDDITNVVNKDHDYCSVWFKDMGLPTLRTAYGGDRQNPCKDINASGKSDYVFSKRLFDNLNRIIHSKNPIYHSRIEFERVIRLNPSSSSKSDSDSDSDSNSDSESSNRSKEADSKISKHSIDQILMVCKVILTRLDDISVWREKSYTMVDDDQLHRIDLNSEVLNGLNCSNAKNNRGEHKRKLKRVTGSNKRSKVDSESSVEEVIILGDKLDNPKEEKNGRVAKKIKLQDIDEIRRINRDILTAQVAPINVKKAQTAEDSLNKHVTTKTSTNESKIAVNVDPKLRNTSKQNNRDRRKKAKRRRNLIEKWNIGYFLCGGNTLGILHFLSSKIETVKMDGEAPSVGALLKLVEYFNVFYRKRLPSCCQARRARSIVLAQRRILARKKPTKPASTYPRFAHQHKLFHEENECACCCKQVLIETPTPSENDYLAVLYRIGSILGDAANGGVQHPQDGTFKTLRDFMRVFSNTKNIKILDNKESKESKGPIVEPPKEINDKTPVDSKEIVKEYQSLPHPVDSKKNFKKQKVSHNNADVQKSLNKLDTTKKSYKESYNDWVMEKNKCNLLFGYKARNITNKNTANESKETQSNANSKSNVEYQTIDNSCIIIDDDDSPIETTKMTHEIGPTKTNTLESKHEINETTTVTMNKIRDGILKSLQNEAKNSEKDAIHDNLNKDFQVPLDQLVNKLGDKSNSEKSENEAVNSKKSTFDCELALDTSGVTRKLETESSNPKSTDKMPIKTLKVRSLEELTGMTPVISTDLARNELNTVDKEVINELQPYTIISDSTVSKNSISQFYNGAGQLIFMPKTLNFEANQPSTSTQKGATRKLVNTSNDPKPTDKIPIKRLQVRSLEQTKGMKSVEQQLNTFDTEVINKLQPYTIISGATVYNNSISQFYNGAGQLIFMPKTLNFEPNQLSTSTQSGKIQIINNCLDSIKISDVMSLKDFNGLSKAPPMSPEQYIVGKDMTKLNVLCMDMSQPVWKVGGDYLLVTYTRFIFENPKFYTMCPGAQAELVVDSRTTLLEDESGRLFSAPEQIIVGGKVLQKIISSPLTYAAVLYVVPSLAQFRRLTPISEGVLFVYGLRDGELRQVRRVRTDKDELMVFCRKRSLIKF